MPGDEEVVVSNTLDAANVGTGGGSTENTGGESSSGAGELDMNFGPEPTNDGESTAGDSTKTTEEQKPDETTKQGGSSETTEGSKKVQEGGTTSTQSTGNTQPKSGTSGSSSGAVPAGNRNYGDFTPEEQKALKGCRNDSYAYFSEKLKELKSLQAEKTELTTKLSEAEKNSKNSIYDHPDGYKLSGEYGELVTGYRQAAEESNFIRNQLVRCQSGQPWKYLQGYDERDNPVYKEMPALKGEAQLSAVESMRLALNKTEAAKDQFQAKASQLQAGYKANYTEAVSRMESRLGAYVASLPEDLRPDDASIKKMIETANPAFRSLPTSKLTAAALVIADRALAKLKKAEESVGNQARQKIDEKLGGPKLTSTKSGQSAGKQEEGDLVDFSELEKQFNMPYAT